MLICFWLPLNKTVLKYLIALWVVSWIFQGNYKQKLLQFKSLSKEHLILLLPVVYFIINAMGIFYSQNTPAALHDIEVKLSLLFFPLIFITIGQSYKPLLNRLLSLFIWGSLAASLVCLIVALLNSVGINHGQMLFETAINQNYTDQSFFLLVGNRQSYFSYAYLSVFHHPGYFSMYLVFAVIVAYYKYRLTEKKRRKTLYLLSIAFFYIMVYLLSTRAGLISLSATLISLTVIEFTKSRHYALVFLVSFTLNYGLYKAITVSKLKSNVEELKEITRPKTEPGTTQKKDIQFKDTRLIIWKNALQIIKNNVWFGVGNGDTRKTLMAEFRNDKFSHGVYKGLNTHNQYFETFISGGVFSFLVLLSFLIIPFFYSLKHNRLILSFLICLVGFNFLFESMLETMAGSIFLSFFYCLLVTIAPPGLTKKPKT
jgi:O-antigen ligase